MPATSWFLLVRQNVLLKQTWKSLKHAAPNWKPNSTEILADARARQEKLDGQTVTVAQKAGVDYRLFYSVTNADIAAAIVAVGIEAVKANVRLPNGPLKAVGEYEVEVALHTDAVAKITVAVIAAAE